jgi:RHS repeat-associated protein
MIERRNRNREIKASRKPTFSYDVSRNPCRTGNGGIYCYYLGNHRIVMDVSGSVVQVNNYYPSGATMADYPRRTDQGIQPYKFGGKGPGEMHGLDFYDFEARSFDPSLMRFTMMDPLAEKYYNISPYVYCANNPVRYIDPTGKIVRPVNEEALKMIHNTLASDDMQYVRLDKYGNIDKDYLNSHTSESGNYGALSELVNSDMMVNVSFSVDDSFNYMDNNGEMQPYPMTYDIIPELSDPIGSDPNSTSTGECGNMGITLLPGKGTSGVNSPDNSIHIIMNEHLSPAAAAEMYSHEANGHALMYVRTGDRKQSGHIFEGSRDTNTPLLNMIKTSKMETIRNMQKR